MPLRASASSHLRAWKCPQCRYRNFNTSVKRQQVGPEHPHYIEIPEPPQQTLPYHPPVKGTLPVPRDVFSDKLGVSRANDEEIAKATALPRRDRKAKPGSREEWKIKMSEARRRNLQEGLGDLKARRDSSERRQEVLRLQRAAEQQEIMNRPEREDERLTAPSHGLDLEKLFHGPLEDPDRESRVARMKSNVAQKEQRKQDLRMASMHTLYMHARDFIVTPEQLDVALDAAFGTPDDPVKFGDYNGQSGDSNSNSVDSMWAYGPPMTVQDMLDKANRTGSRREKAIENAGGYGEIKQDRIRRIAEGLTGGSMDVRSR